MPRSMVAKIGSRWAERGTVFLVAELSDGSIRPARDRFSLAVTLQALPIAHWPLEKQSTGQIIRFNLEIQGGEHVVVDLRQGFQQALSDFQGNVIRGILPDSDEFEVLPGSNTLAFYATGTTGDTEISLRWQPRHWSF